MEEIINFFTPVDVQRGLAGFEGAGQLARMGEQASKMGVLDAAQLERIGGKERQMGQRGLDLAYQDFLEQRDLPMDRVKFMSDIVRGLPTQTATQVTERGPLKGAEFGPSGLESILGAYKLSQGEGGARGGYVQPFNEGGLARVTITLGPEDYEEV